MLPDNYFMKLTPESVSVPSRTVRHIGSAGVYRTLGELAISDKHWINIDLGVGFHKSGEDILKLAAELQVPVGSIPWSKELARELLQLRFGDRLAAFEDFYESIHFARSFGKRWRVALENPTDERMAWLEECRKLPLALKEFYPRTELSGIFGYGTIVKAAIVFGEGEEVIISQQLLDELHLASAGSGKSLASLVEEALILLMETRYRRK